MKNKNNLIIGLLFASQFIVLLIQLIYYKVDVTTEFILYNIPYLIVGLLFLLNKKQVAMYSISILSAYYLYYLINTIVAVGFKDIFLYPYIAVLVLQYVILMLYYLLPIFAVKGVLRKQMNVLKYFGFLSIITYVLLIILGKLSLSYNVLYMCLLLLCELLPTYLAINSTLKVAKKVK